MDFYNIVLRPPKDLAQKLIAFSAENFRGVSDGYFLSEEVRPHITLCQFKASEKPDITFNEIKMSPVLCEYFVRAGEGQHYGYAWAEMSVEYQEWLFHLHNYAKNKLSSVEAPLEILTEIYRPHLTFCRVKEDDIKKIENVSVPNDFCVKYEPWTIEMGRSDLNGQYLGQGIEK